MPDCLLHTGTLEPPHLRLSDQEIVSDLIGKGSADMILSMELLESLRYLGYLCSEGFLVTSTNPVRNIPDYPDLDDLYDKIKGIARSRSCTIGKTHPGEQ